MTTVASDVTNDSMSLATDAPPEVISPTTEVASETTDPIADVMSSSCALAATAKAATSKGLVKCIFDWILGDFCGVEQ